MTSLPCASAQSKPLQLRDDLPSEYREPLVEQIEPLCVMGKVGVNLGGYITQNGGVAVDGEVETVKEGEAVIRFEHDGYYDVPQRFTFWHGDGPEVEVVVHEARIDGENIEARVTWGGLA